MSKAPSGGSSRRQSTTSRAAQPDRSEDTLATCTWSAAVSSSTVGQGVTQRHGTAARRARSAATDGAVPGRCRPLDQALVVRVQDNNRCRSWAWPPSSGPRADHHVRSGVGLRPAPGQQSDLSTPAA